MQASAARGSTYPDAVPFLHGTSTLPATLMGQQTGAFIRFTTSQLPSLPPAEMDCTVVLPHGRVVRGHFNRNRKNPNINGAELRRWILANVPRRRSLEVRVSETSAGRIAILPAEAVPAGEGLGPEIAALAEAPAERRRAEFERWERSPSLREKLLSIWAHVCQVEGCSTLTEFPEADRIAALEVHHLEHVGDGGTDGIMNLCLICANHHRLIHLGRPPAALLSSGATEVRVGVGSVALIIRRDLGVLLRSP